MCYGRENEIDSQSKLEEAAWQFVFAMLRTCNGSGCTLGSVQIKSERIIVCLLNNISIKTQLKRVHTGSLTAYEPQTTGERCTKEKGTNERH